ncbi:MAG: sulfotransferase, partial [Phycisphaerales bacterium]|nr:sulfotransferase [Phycisphaerales bacterium]
MCSVEPIFLFSQPRAGSTLLQRILAAHPEVHTAAEPWILLPLFYALREGGAVTEYGQPLSAQAIGEFCAPMPRGIEEYRDAARGMAMDLYARAAPEGARYFLDKTPRYYFIAGDIVRSFGDAKFVFLWRQPLASAASMIARWGRDRWSVYTTHHDLYTAPRRLAAARAEAGDRALDVRYEDLVTEPEATVDRLIMYLGLDADGPTREAMVHGFSGVELSGSMGDPTGRKAYDTLNTEPLEKWKSAVTNGVRKRWCLRYLDELGDELVASMGYDAGVLRDEIGALHVGMRGSARDWFRLK